MCNDKSETSLAVEAVLFHPLHLTLLNFLEQSRQHDISNGFTIISYMPALCIGSTLICSTERFDEP